MNAVLFGRTYLPSDIFNDFEKTGRGGAIGVSADSGMMISLHLAIESVSRRPSFEAHMQPVVSVSQRFDRSLDRRRIVLNIAHKPNFPGSATLRDRHGVRLLGDIESH